MVKKSPLSIFRGKQGQVYAVLLLVWENYQAKLKDFQKKNAKYTEELATEQTEAIKKARDIPDVAVRRDVPKEARITLGMSASACREGWQDLSGLIEKSFPENEWEVKKGLAGSASYKKASAEQWDAVVTLTNAATGFINDNTEALTAGGMLPAFPTGFAASKKTYDDLYNSYYGTKQGFSQQTTAKAAANNAVYKEAMSMMNDAKRIYRQDARTRADFTYESLMKKIRGEGFTKTGYRILLKDKATGLPVTDASILFVGSTLKKEGSATAKGIITADMPAGTYQYTLTVPGFTTLIGTVKMVDGSRRQKTLKLSADAGTSSNLQALAV